MKTKLVKRYYCDYCKKSGCSAFHIGKHERGCTANPHRVCKMCSAGTREIGPLKAILVPYVETGGEYTGVPETQHLVTEESFKMMADAVGNCPACILWVLRAAKACVHHWNFKDAQKHYWDELNNATVEMYNA